MIIINFKFTNIGSIIIKNNKKEGKKRKKRGEMLSRLPTYFLVFSIHDDDVATGSTLELDGYRALGSKLRHFSTVYHPSARFSLKCGLPPTILQVS